MLVKALAASTFVTCDDAGCRSTTIGEHSRHTCRPNQVSLSRQLWWTLLQQRQDNRRCRRKLMPRSGRRQHASPAASAAYRCWDCSAPRLGSWSASCDACITQQHWRISRQAKLLLHLVRTVKANACYVLHCQDTPRTSCTQNSQTRPFANRMSCWRHMRTWWVWISLMQWT